MMFDLNDYIGEFCSSDHFLFLDATVKDHAESLLAHWCGLVGNADIDVVIMERTLAAMARLDAPVDVRKAVPDLLNAFFDYLASSGKAPYAKNWPALVSLVERQYCDGFRDDGSVRGQTFVKKYTDTNRNDPCPCGSGKKFKKCCMQLIG